MSFIDEGGAVVINIIGRTDAFDEAMQRVEDSTLGRMTNVANTVAVGFAAVGASITGAFGLMVNKFADTADTFDEMSQRTDVSISSLYELSKVAEMNGSSAQGLEGALTRMQRAIVEASEQTVAAQAEAAQKFAETGEVSEEALTGVAASVEKLGLNIEALRGMNTEQAFLAIGAAIAGVADPAERTAIAMEIFGREGTKIVTMFADGADGLAAAREAFHETGLSIEENAHLAGELEAEWAKVSDAWMAVSAEVAPILVEALVPMIEKLGDAVKWVADLAREYDGAATTLVQVVAGFGAVAVAMAPVIASVSGLATIVGTIHALSAASAAAGVAATAAAGTAGAAGAAGAAAAGGTGLLGMAGAAGVAGIAITGLAMGAAILGTTALILYPSLISLAEAKEDLRASTEALTEAEAAQVQALRAQGVAIDENAMKTMDFDQRQAYLADQEKLRSEALAVIWFEYYAQREAGESDFATMRNLMLNQGIDAQAAAVLASKGLDQEQLRSAMQMTEAETAAFLEAQNIQLYEAMGAQNSISLEQEKQALARVEMWQTEAREAADANKKAAEESIGYWESFVSWWRGVWNSVTGWFGGMPAIPAPATAAFASGGVVGFAAGGVVGRDVAPIVVGERGPEAMIAPVGSRIVSHEEAIAALGGAGGDYSVHVAVNHPVVRDEADLSRLTEAIAQEVSRAQRQMFDRRMTGVGARGFNA